VPSDVDRAVQIAVSLRHWLSREYDGAVIDAAPPGAVGDGFDAIVVAAQFAGETLPAEWRQPLILRAPPNAERYPAADRETRLQTWCADHGYPAPRPVALLPPGEVDEFPVQVVARAPGRTMTAVFTSRPWRLPALVRRLAQAAAALHALPVPPWADGPDWSLAERRLALPRHLLTLLPDPALRAGLGAVERLLPQLEEGRRTVCHGDFHPFNVLVQGRRLAVIDWTDAGIGDPHGDVARTLLLFRVIGTAAPSAAERAVLGGIGPLLARRYLATYRRRQPLDEDRLRLWEPVHLLQLWAQALADKHEIFGPSLAGVRFRHGLASILHERLQAALAAA